MPTMTFFLFILCISTNNDSAQLSLKAVNNIRNRSERWSIGDYEGAV